MEATKADREVQWPPKRRSGSGPIRISYFRVLQGRSIANLLKIRLSALSKPEGWFCRKRGSIRVTLFFDFLNSPYLGGSKGRQLRRSHLLALWPKTGRSGFLEGREAPPLQRYWGAVDSLLG